MGVFEIRKGVGLLLQFTTMSTALIDALRDPLRYPHAAESIEVIETHISWVVLAGDFAYKIKKPVDFGFLDFSTLARRRHCCDEELRINRRLAPQLYLEVVGLGGSPEQPELGGETPFEYAVKMRRFAPEDGFDRLLERGALTPELLDRLAERLAAFHRDGAAVAERESPWGRPETVVTPVRENIEQIGPLLDSADDQAQLQRIATWSEAEAVRLGPWLEARRAAGRVRECHGDLHLGNIALYRDEPLIFDAIEFNPALRWIDTCAEIAFLVMDLDDRQRPDLARRFLNHYLETSGDYDLLHGLRFYLSYRAMVRAKVGLLRAAQASGEAARHARDEALGYLALAERYTQPPQPGLWLMHGLSGSGKSRTAAELVAQCGLIRLRSDVERKRLHGLEPLARTRPEVGAGIYTAEASQRTFDHLRRLAESILASGHSPLIDATFLRQRDRAPFTELARRLGVELTLVARHAPVEVLRARVAARAARGDDPSEAGIEVLEQQLRQVEPPTEAEVDRMVSLGPDEPLPQAVLSR